MKGVYPIDTSAPRFHGVSLIAFDEVDQTALHPGAIFGAVNIVVFPDHADYEWHFQQVFDHFRNQDKKGCKARLQQMINRKFPDNVRACATAYLAKYYAY